MAFGSDRRRLGVLDEWVAKVFGDAQGLRGEKPLVRGSESRRRRCTASRDGGSRASRASRALQSERGRVRFSVPRSRARCANGV